MAVYRHQRCIAATLQALRASRNQQASETLTERLDRYRGIAEGLLEDNNKVLFALDRCHKQIEIEAKLTGAYQKKQENEKDKKRERQIIIECFNRIYKNKPKAAELANIERIYAATDDDERREVIAQILDESQQEMNNHWAQAENQVRQKGFVM
jgi:hypothetical protein